MTLAELYQLPNIQKSTVKTDKTTGKEYIIKKRGVTLTEAAQEIAETFGGSIGCSCPNYAEVVVIVEGKKAFFYVNAK